jgi:hypothetical protein
LTLANRVLGNARGAACYRFSSGLP